MGKAKAKFSYEIILEIDVDGIVFEFHKNWITDVQLKVGDYVYVDGLEEVKVVKVVWFMNRRAEGMVDLGRIDCQGPPEEWAHLLNEFAYCVPDISKPAPAASQAASAAS